jgi:endonuclease/exonuclease/phosphatase family metal-dependent hydrolase
VFAGQVLMAVWFLNLCATPPVRAAGPSVFRGSLGSAALVFVIAVLVYYVSYDVPMGIHGDGFLPFFAGLLMIGGIAGLRAPDYAPTAARSFRSALAAAVLLVLPLAYWLSSNAPKALEPAPGNREVRIMTYNLHQAFNTKGQLDIEALAQQIEESGADVIGLQEVPRGYLTAGSFDLIGWLSRRLDMPYVFGPAADAQSGNALLSRYPIIEAEVLSLPPNDLLLLRSVIRASIDMGDGEITVLVTHLHHKPPDGEIRQEQVAAVLESWGGSAQAVILGDLNATPDSAEIRLLADAGLLEAGALGESPALTVPSEDPDRQFDYIWYTTDLAGSDYAIYPTNASDHLPVAVTLELP